MTFTYTAWGLGTLPADSWVSRAACNPQTAELFWPIGHGVARDVSRALTICGHCPVIHECGRYAVDHGEVDGIWGGMREEQLRTLVGIEPNPRQTRRTRACGPCIRCDRVRELTRRDLCVQCTNSESGRGRLHRWPVVREVNA